MSVSSLLDVRALAGPSSPAAAGSAELEAACCGNGDPRGVPAMTSASSAAASASGPSTAVGGIVTGDGLLLLFEPSLSFFFDFDGSPSFFFFFFFFSFSGEEPGVLGAADPGRSLGSGREDGRADEGGMASQGEPRPKRVRRRGILES